MATKGTKTDIATTVTKITKEKNFLCALSVLCGPSVFVAFAAFVSFVAPAAAQQPRGEWMNIQSGLQTTRTYIVHAPKGRSSIVVLVPDQQADADSLQAVGGRLAGEGFTVLIPDLRAAKALQPADVSRHVTGVLDYADKLPAVTGKRVVLTFGAAALPGVKAPVVRNGEWADTVSQLKAHTR